MGKAIYKKFLYLSYRLENNWILETIKNGFLLILPIIFIGAIALAITSFPSITFQNQLSSLLGGSIYSLLQIIYQITYGFMSIYITISVSYNCARFLYPNHSFMRTACILLSLMCLIECLGIGSENFTYAVFGTTGTFMAIVIAIIAPLLFHFVQKSMNFIHKKTSLKFNELDYHNIQIVFFPFGISVILFGAINVALIKIFNISSLNELFALFFGYAFKHLGSTLFSGELFIFASGALWFFGIHGGNALELVSQNNFVPANTIPDKIISKSFMDVFGLMGGSGATICLLLALLIFSKNRNHRGLAKSTTPMVIFNINELFIFGLPIILNPVMLLPFILTPMVSLAIAYIATITNLIPISTTTVTWTTPVLFSGYLLTGTPIGAIVQLVSIIIGTLIYAPFVLLLEKVEYEKTNFLLEQIEDKYKQALAVGENLQLNSLHYGLDKTYRSMLAKLSKDIISRKVALNYQPQVNSNEEIIGAEALLRWRFTDRPVFPPLVIEMAKEGNLINSLSLAILEQSCKDTKKIIKRYPTFKMSVNMVGEQINDKSFVTKVINVIKKHKLQDYICIEITEETNLDGLPNLINNVRLMKENNILLSLDDFSMGHTSVKYLQDSLFDFVKLDGSLVEDMMINQRSETIIKFIVDMGKQLNFKTVAEFVDSQDKRLRLLELGTTYLQGYLYSPAVTVEAFIKLPKVIHTK